MSAAQAIKDLFVGNPNINFSHNEVREHLDVLRIWCREPQRQVRTFHAQGLLQYISDGLYCYNPDKAFVKVLAPEFTKKQRDSLINEDSCCSICGKTSGLVVDHIIPREDKNSSNNIDNAQILCSSCNNIKKNDSMAIYAIKILMKASASKYENAIQEIRKVA